MRKSKVCSNIVHYFQVVIHLRFADWSFLESDWLLEFNLLNIAYLHLTIYLAIVGSKTRFRPGISSLAQRGWFVSWAVIGILYGSAVPFAAKIRQIAPVGMRSWVLELGVLCCGAAAMGGVVAMVQQYLQFVEC